MTKTEAKKRAAAALRRGHFRPGKGVDPVPGTGPLVYQNCPLCGGRVEYEGMAWDSSAALERGLRGELADHLAGEH